MTRSTPTFSLTLLIFSIAATLPCSWLSAADSPDRDTQQKLQAVDQEIARLREADPKTRPNARAYADQLAAMAAQIRQMLDAKDAPGSAPELYVVGVYEGVFPEGPRKYGTVAVDVEAANRPIVLALCAYDPVKWDLRVAKGAQIQRLIVAGYKDQQIIGAPAGLNVEKHFGKEPGAKYFYAYQRDGESFPRAAAILRELTGLQIAAFVGEYRPRTPLVVGPSNPSWRLQRAMTHLEPLWREASALERSRQRQAFANVRFPAIKWNPGERPFGVAGEVAEFTVAGPIQSTLRTLPRDINRVAIDPRGPTCYGIQGHSNVAHVDLNTQKVTPMEIEADIPELSWPCGVAFDTKRNRLILTSFGGVGYMYGYDPGQKQRSLVRDMANVDLQCLTYSAQEDCFYGLGANRGERKTVSLYRFDHSGQVGEFLQLDLILPGGPERMHFSPPQLAAIGKHLAILTAPMANPFGQGELSPMTCHVIEPKSGKVVYTGEMRDRVPPATDVTAAQLKTLWAELRQAPTAAAEKLVTQLAAGGDAAVSAIRDDLPPLQLPNPAKVHELIARLDRDEWKDREDATSQLLNMGGSIEPALRQARAAAQSDEVRSRIAVILRELQALLESRKGSETIDALIRDPALRARLRAIRVLGQIATPNAAELLQDLAAAVPGSLDSEHARAALRAI